MGEENEPGGVVEGGVDENGKGADEWVAWGVVEAESVDGSVQPGFEPVVSEQPEPDPFDLVGSQPFSDVPDDLLTEEQEQAIRDHFGYARSETRTRAERNATAARIVERTKDQVAWAKRVWADQAALTERRDRQLTDVRALRLIAEGKKPA